MPKEYNHYGRFTKRGLWGPKASSVIILMCRLGKLVAFFCASVSRLVK